VDYLEPLTKQDLLSFYHDFIAPSSPIRAKIAVHLVAQGTPVAVLENANPEAKAKLVMAALIKFFDAQGIPANAAQIARRFVDADIKPGDSNSAPLVGAVMTYLTEDAKIPAAKATSVVQQGILFMQAAQAKGEEQTLLTSEKPTSAETKNKPILIEDVRAFKSTLQLSLGPQPVKHLTEYEETEAKL
jgi:insulysin